MEVEGEGRKGVELLAADLQLEGSHT